MTRSKKLLLFLSGSTFLLLLIVLSAGLWFASAPGENYLRQFLENTLNSSLDVQVSIEKFETDLLGFVHLKEMVVTDESGGDTTRILIDQLQVHYSLAGILRKTITITQVLGDGLTIQLKADSSGNWIVGNLLEPGDPESSSSWSVDLQQVKIQGSQLSIGDRQSGLSLGFDSLSLQLDGKAGVFEYALDAAWLTSERGRPQGSLNARGLIGAEQLTFSGLKLINPEFELTGTLNLGLSDPAWPIQSDLKIKGSPLALLPPLSALTGVELPAPVGNMDLHLGLTGAMTDPVVSFEGQLNDFGLSDYPSVTGFFQGHLNSAAVLLDTVDMVVLNTPIQIKGELAFDSLSTFSIQGKIPPIPIEQSLAQFYGTQEDYQGMIQGVFVGSGMLEEIENIDLTASFDISRATWLGKPIPRTSLDARIIDRRAHVKFSQGSNWLRASAHVDSLEDLAATLDFNFPDLAPLVPYTPLAGLTGTISGSASLNRKTNKVNYRAKVQGNRFNYQGLTLDDIFLDVTGTDTEWKIRSGQISAKQVDLASLNQFRDSPVLKGRATYSANLEGGLKDLKGTVNISARAIWIDSLLLDSTRMNFSIDKQQVSISKATLFWSKQRFIASGMANWMTHAGNLKVTAAQRGPNKWIDQGTVSTHVYELKRDSFVDLEAQKFDLSLLATLVPELAELKGTLSGKANAKFGRTLELASASMYGRSLSWAGEQVQLLDVVGRFDKKQFILDTLHVVNGEEELLASLRLPIDLASRSIRSKAKLSATIAMKKLELQRSRMFLDPQMEISGKLNSTLSVSGSYYSPRFNGDLTVLGAVIKIPDLPNIKMDSLFAQLEEQRIYLRDLDCRVGEHPLKLTGQADLFDTENYYLRLIVDKQPDGRVHTTFQSKGGVLSSSLKVQSLDLSVLGPFLASDQDIKGRLEANLTMKDLSGSPRIEGQVKIADGQLTLSKSSPPIQAINVGISLIQDRININRADGKLGTYPFSLKGTIIQRDWSQFKIQNELDIAGVRALSVNGDLSAEHMDLTVVIPSMDMASWQPFLPDMQGLSGRLAGRISLSGPFDLPQISGALAVNDMSVKLPMIDPLLTNGQMATHFEGTTIHLDSLSFRQGNKGVIHVRGDMIYFEDKLPNLDMIMRVDQIKLKEANVAKATIEKVRLSYKGNSEKYQLDGSIVMGASTYMKKITPQALLKLVRSSTQPIGQVEPLLARSQIKVKIQESDQIAVHNNLAHIRLKPDLTIIGTFASPVPTGRVKVEEGYILYLDRRFVVTAGTFDFQDPYRINPIVDFHAKCQLKPYQTRSKKEYAIFIDLVGPADAIQVNLRSEPVLDRTDILTLLTMGATRQELSQSNPNLDNASLGKLLQDRLSDYSSQKISAYTADRLGTVMNLESISIEGDLFNFGKSWGPQLVASKKLGEKTTLTYSTAVGHATDQNVKLEYELTNGVSVEGQTDQKGRSGIDLKFGFKFK